MWMDKPIDLGLSMTTRTEISKFIDVSCTGQNLYSDNRSNGKQ